MRKYLILLKSLLVALNTGLVAGLLSRAGAKQTRNSWYLSAVAQEVTSPGKPPKSPGAAWPEMVRFERETVREPPVSDHRPEAPHSTWSCVARSMSFPKAVGAKTPNVLSKNGSKVKIIQAPRINPSPARVTTNPRLFAGSFSWPRQTHPRWIAVAQERLGGYNLRLETNRATRSARRGCTFRQARSVPEWRWWWKSVHI